ncbi:uncharacterized protein [Branchiostoma lanceolatum]|uniref:uncharacterized protein isoform X2 n=1 Tax=Branchiostoma lanceolatum TaxID=7740 RepID=UPI0034552502
MTSQYVVLLCLMLSMAEAAPFVNYVQPPPKKDLYEFYWEVGHWETMFYYEEENNAGTPVRLTGYDQFQRREPDRNDPTNCNKSVPMTREEVNNVVAADGSYTRVVLVNRTLPGPSIVVWKNAQVAVHVTNSLLQEGITIHWHGLTQHNTSWMDGVGGVSQCPINPGESFTYRFNASEGGTHWWHAHSGTFRTDGLYGALIVLEDDPGLPRISRDFLVLLQDWQREDSLDTYLRVEWEASRFSYGYDNYSDCYYNKRQPDGTEIGPVPFVSGLINGKGRRFYDVGPEAEDPNVPLELFEVRRGDTYRFRVISAAMIYAYRVSIDRHELTMIATDGNRISGQRAESFIINTGERYDFYITANQRVDNYWIRAETLEETDIYGVDRKGVGITPCLDSECGGEKFCECTYHINITYGNVIQLVLYNMVAGGNINGTAHPVHIHGHHFYVLDMGFPEYDNDTGTFVTHNTDIDCTGFQNCNGRGWVDDSWKNGSKPGLNNVNPPLKDTVIVPVGGYVVLRFLADNPGWWFMHCHIEIHQVEGMAMMIREGTEGLMNRPPPNFPTCGSFDWSSQEFKEAEKGYGKPRTGWNLASDFDKPSFGIGLGAGIAIGIIGIFLTVGYFKCSSKSHSNYQQLPGLAGEDGR